MPIGLFLLGHGQLASGFLSALEKLQTHTEGILVLDYDPEMSEPEFEKEVDALLEKQEGDLIFLVDLPGTIPYRVACKKANEHFYVLSGLNLGMLIEANAMRQFTDDIDQLCSDLIVVGQSQILEFKN